MTPGGQAQIGNVDLVKQLNSAAVYRLIDQYGPISRIQIAEQSQLAPASVTKITRQLIERGLIKEVDQQASTGGPPRYLYCHRNPQFPRNRRTAWSSRRHHHFV